MEGNWRLTAEKGLQANMLNSQKAKNTRVSKRERMVSFDVFLGGELFEMASRTAACVSFCPLPWPLRKVLFCYLVGWDSPPVARLLRPNRAESQEPYCIVPSNSIQGAQGPQGPIHMLPAGTQGDPTKTAPAGLCGSHGRPKQLPLSKNFSQTCTAATHTAPAACCPAGRHPPLAPLP